MNTHRHQPDRKALLRAAITFAIVAILAIMAHGQAPAATVAESNHPAFQVKASGQGRAIIMIPGLASSGATFDGLVEHLAAHFRCYQLTLAGFAGLPPISGPLLTEARDQIAQYIRDNHIDRPIIMGHSLGGFVALDLAERNPGLVGPVVIVDSLPFFAQSWFRVDTLAAAQPTIDKMRAGMEALTPEQWQATARSGASTNSMATAEKDQKTLIDWNLASDRKSVIDAMIALVSTDLRPDLGKIQTPVLVIGTWVGLKAYGVTEDQATALFHQQYSGVKDLKFVMAEKARHFVMWDDPAWFNTQVGSFLASTSATVAAR